jgi:hypothetical protein
MFDPTPIQIIDAGDRILIHGYEYDIERVIHMDADESGAEPQGSPLGYSVGRWDGDTLRVTTTHIDWPYLDPQGNPQSNQMTRCVTPRHSHCPRKGRCWNTR